MLDKGYEFFEHTADVGLRVDGSTLRELFTHAARGLVELCVGESALEPKTDRPVSLEAPNVERLLHAWLDEVLFWFSAEQFVPAAYDLDVTETRLQGRIGGERFDPARHASGVEVKGITYHEFQVGRTDDGWTARVIVDV